MGTGSLEDEGLRLETAQAFWPDTQQRAHCTYAEAGRPPRITSDKVQPLLCITLQAVAHDPVIRHTVVAVGGGKHARAAWRGSTRLEDEAVHQ